MTRPIDWRELLLGKIADHSANLEPVPTADQMEAWSDGLANVVADVIDLKPAGEVHEDTEERMPNAVPRRL